MTSVVAACRRNAQRAWAPSCWRGRMSTTAFLPREELERRVKLARAGDPVGENDTWSEASQHAHIKTKDFHPDDVDAVRDALREEGNGELWVTKCNTFKVLNIRPAASAASTVSGHTAVQR